MVVSDVEQTEEAMEEMFDSFAFYDISTDWKFLFGVDRLCAFFNKKTVEDPEMFFGPARFFGECMILGVVGEQVIGLRDPNHAMQIISWFTESQLAWEQHYGERKPFQTLDGQTIN